MLIKGTNLQLESLGPVATIKLVQTMGPSPNRRQANIFVAPYFHHLTEKGNYHRTESSFIIKILHDHCQKSVNSPFNLLFNSHDFVVEFIHLTILHFRLKEEISEQFPGNPGPENQKLVYAGRILEDRDRLKSIIRLV